MPRQQTHLAVPDPAVNVPDDELIIQQILEVAELGGLPVPLNQLIQGRVFCPTEGLKATGETVEYKNDRAAVIFRIEDGTRRTDAIASTVEVTIFCTGGRIPEKNDKTLAQAKATYRALVHRLGRVDHEDVPAGTLVNATELSVGRAEKQPGTNWPVYRSRWRIHLRRKG